VGYWHEDKFGQRQYVSTEKAGGETPESFARESVTMKKSGLERAIMQATARDPLAPVHHTPTAAETFKGWPEKFLRERQAQARRDMDAEYKNPHPNRGEHNARMMKHAEIHNAARDELRRQGVPEKSVQEGARGGRFYVSATGAKVYVASNPGAETVGHMRNQRFHMGLPMSCHLAEPKKNG
jgi:hypothetical protein